MGSSNFYDTSSFGDALAILMRSKGLESDERLARKAMLIQRKLDDRINIERRTINNWRNNRSKPRSPQDRRYNLILEALDTDSGERNHLNRFLLNALHEQQTSTPSKGTRNKLFKMQPVAFVLTMIVTTGLLLFGLRYFLNETAPLPDRGQTLFLAAIPDGTLTLSGVGYIIPHSDESQLTRSHLETLNGWELYIARNEIFARYGREFTFSSSVCLRSHFAKFTKTSSNQTGWYQPLAKARTLTPLAVRNAHFIRDYECNQRGGRMDCSGTLQRCKN